MTRPGRLLLVNSVITAMATYFLTIFTASAWAEKRLNKIRRNFLWNAGEEGNGGKCMVNWKAICAPKQYGGLDIKDIGRFGRSLRLRWLWNEWQVEDKPWKGTAHNLRTGDFLVFKYDGHSQLKVLIFGPSGCEKIQACNLMKNAAPGKEWWGNTAGIVNTRHNLPMKFPRSGRQIRASMDSSRQGNDIINVSSSSSASDSEGGISTTEDGHSLSGCILAKCTLLNLNHVQKKQLEEKIRAINSEIPIYGCVIRKSSIYGATRTLEISRKYAELYLPFEEQMLTLQHHGKKWEVRCRVKKSKAKRLLRGWKHFARGNNLQLGDVCLFEVLRNKKKYVMNVYIIRKSLYKRKCSSEEKLATRIKKQK